MNTRPTRGPSCWRQWYISDETDRLYFEGWLRSNAHSIGPGYGFRAQDAWVATNVPLTTIRRYARGSWYMPSDFNTLTYDEVVELFDE